MKKHAHPTSEEDGTFSLFTTCNNERCAATEAAVGSFKLMKIPGAKPVPHFRIRRFYRSPPVINLGAEVSREVHVAVRSACSHVWNSPEACANSLRTAVELMLDELKIPKTSKSGAGKRNRLTLHSRIEKLRNSHPVAAEYLMAVKWIGNWGSHYVGKDPSMDDILTCFEAIEQAYDDLFSHARKRILKSAQQISKRKGRPARPRKP